MQRLPMCVDWRNGENLKEAGKTLQKRLSDNTAVKKHGPKNGIAVHAGANQHHVNWKAATVKEEERVCWKRRVLESLHIYQQHQTSRLDFGHHQHLLASSAVLVSLPPLRDRPTTLPTSTLTINFTKGEIRRCVRKLKKGKAEGVCGISGELLKAGGEVVIEWLSLI